MDSWSSKQRETSNYKVSTVTLIALPVVLATAQDEVLLYINKLLKTHIVNCLLQFQEIYHNDIMLRSTSKRSPKKSAMLW